MSTGRWHLRVHLRGREVVADYREPITGAIERVHRARRMRPEREPELSDVEAILAWHEQNAAMVADCRMGACGHDVV